MSVEVAGATDPVNSHKDGEDNRWYVHPVSQERFLSVTTGLKSVAKDALVPWASLLAAKTAMAELPRLVRALFTRDCGRTYRRCDHPWDQPCPECPCRACKTCTIKWLGDRHIAESSRRADEGTRVHEAIKFWVIWGQMPANLPQELHPYITSFLQFVEDFGLTPADWQMAEGTILNRKHGYAGTLDQIIKIDPSRTDIAAEWCDRAGRTGQVTYALVDTKSREGEGAQMYLDHTLQLVGYSRGETVMLPNGQEVPLPHWDQTAVLQVRPDGYTLQHTWHTEEEFQAFLSAVSLFKWQLERGRPSISSRSFPMSDQFKRDRTNRRARERRAATKKTTATTPPARNPNGSVGAGSLPANLPQPRPTPPSASEPEVPIRRLGGTPETTKTRTPARSTPRTAPSARELIMPSGPPVHPNSPFGDDIPF